MWIFELDQIYKLYCGLFIFWTTYFCASLLFPIDKEVTRPKANITKQKVLYQLICNCLATVIILPLLAHIPQILTFPLIWYGYLCKYLTALIIIEIWFYYTHRLMHHRWFYRWHADHHSFIEPYALAGLYCSSVEMILVNLLSVVVPFQLLGFSFTEAMIGPIFVALNVLKGHAVLHKRNHNFKSFPYMLTQSWDHDIHHRIMTCNFGIIYLLDRIHGTYVGVNKANLKKRNSENFWKIMDF